MAENNFSLQKTLTMLLDEKKYHSLRDILSTMNPADIAAIFDDLDQARLPLLFRLLPKELAAETFVEMEPEAQELLIQGFSDSELKEVIDELYVDDADDIVEEMPACSASYPKPSRTCASRSMRFCVIRRIPPARS